jgi:hypothetical protein
MACVLTASCQVAYDIYESFRLKDVIDEVGILF